MTEPVVLKFCVRLLYGVHSVHVQYPSGSTINGGRVVTSVFNVFSSILPINTYFSYKSDFRDLKSYVCLVHIFISSQKQNLVAVITLNEENRLEFT